MAATLFQAGRSPSRHHEQSMDSGYVTVPGGQLYYEAIGRGPVVILLHGGCLDRRMWDDQMPILASRFRVVR